MVEPTTLIELAKTAKEVVSWKSLETYRKRFLYQIQNGTVVMPIFGAGGVGKTTFSKIMQGVNPLDIDLNYDESLKTKFQVLRGIYPIELQVSMGQKSERSVWDKIVKDLNNSEETLLKKQKIIIINIVSYGYNDFRQFSFRDHDLSKKIDNADSFIQKYTELQRQEELESIKYLVNILKNLNKPYELVTLISKQDLWFDRREEVLDFYFKGEYEKSISILENIKDSKLKQHHILPTAFAISNFATQSGELLKPTASGYDFTIYLSFIEQMKRQLNSLLEI